MRHQRSHPIGKTWSQVLRIVYEAGWITTQGVAERLKPLMNCQLNRAGSALGNMAKAGYVRLGPWRPVKLWCVGGAGAHVAAAMATPAPPRRYRSYPEDRKKAKARRDAAAKRNRCVNENLRGTHGPATHGCRCFACDQTHKRSR